MSTTGVSPVTVTVSCTPPTAICASTLTTREPVSSSPSRRTVEKPGSVNDEGVGARPQIDDAILAGAVRDDRASAFDERRTSGFDRDTWEHRARRVFHDPGKGTLRKRRRGSRESAHQTEKGRILRAAVISASFDRSLA